MQNVFLIVDCESTMSGKCADFSGVVVNSSGEILHECSVLTELFLTEQLYHNKDITGLWSVNRLQERTSAYQQKLEEGTRQLASVGAINRWLEKVANTYSGKRFTLYATAYNISYDLGCLDKTGIRLDSFPNKFCLWGLALGNIAATASYKRFILQNHYFSNRTEKLGAVTMLTSAEVMSHYVKGFYQKEEHTAREDIIDHELPILLNIIKRRKWKHKTKVFNYKDYQLKDCYKVK
jgi:hypothetical protein